MARIIGIGAGAVGLGTAMLLARDGHDVVVLERDAPPPSASADEAWTTWQRRSVNQFRLPHFLLARTRKILDTELPDVARAVEDEGGLRMNPLLQIPEEIRGSERPGDGEFECLTARRPVFESAFARVAEGTDRLDVRRGAAVESLVVDTAAARPTVIGVRTAEGDELRGDLVVDLGGRRSAMPKLLADAGLPTPVEELDDSGFMYFGRHFVSSDGSVPFALGPGIMHLGTITSLTLPADNGTWGLVIVTNAKDRALLGLRDPDRWETVFKSLPLVAHWLDGTPLEDGVVTISKIEDRIRTYVVDGAPVATGVVAVGDAWSCSNPSQGRGVSIGMLHGTVLRDTLRSAGLDDKDEFAFAFHEATESTVRPWFEWTRSGDRHRLAEVDAMIDGKPYKPDDPAFEMERALGAAATLDPGCLRAGISATLVLTPLDESLRDAGLRARALELGASWRDQPVLAPSRDELVAMATA